MGKKGVATSVVLISVAIVVGLMALFVTWEYRPIGGNFEMYLGLTFSLVSKLGTGKRPTTKFDWRMLKTQEYCSAHENYNVRACKLIDVRKVCGPIFLLLLVVGILSFMVTAGLLARYTSQSTPRRISRLQALLASVVGAASFCLVELLFTVLHYLGEFGLGDDEKQADGGVFTHFTEGYWMGLIAAVCAAAVPTMSGLWVSTSEESTELRREEQMYLEEVGGYESYGGAQAGGVQDPFAPVKDAGQ